jgi:hypothetical protein
MYLQIAQKNTKLNFIWASPSFSLAISAYSLEKMSSATILLHPRNRGFWRTLKVVQGYLEAKVGNFEVGWVDLFTFLPNVGH